MMMKPKLCLFSGGSGWNPYVKMLQEITEQVTYIMPVSDDGGSTSEIVKAIGGPGIGDLRSRIIRLADASTDERKAIHDLLSYRLSTNPSDAVNELNQFMTFKHKLCRKITTKMIKLHFLTFLRHFLWQLLSQPKGLCRSAQIDKLELDTSFSLYYDEKVDDEEPLQLSNLNFDFRHGSIGNFYLTGAMLFFKSLDIALSQMRFLLSCPVSSYVYPVVSSEFVMGKPKKAHFSKRRCRSLSRRSQKDFALLESSFSPRMSLTITRSIREQPIRLLDQRSVVISAILTNGQRIIGQCAISHPGKAVGEFAPEIHRKSLNEMTPVGFEAPVKSLTSTSNSVKEENPQSSSFSDLTSSDSSCKCGSLSTCSSPTCTEFSPNSTSLNLWNESFQSQNISNLFFSKTQLESLPASIRRIHYIDRLEREICPPIHPGVYQELSNADHIIYTVGSLYTSLISCLVVPGVGNLIANSDTIWNKILMLNGSTDRETEGYDAIDFILAITDALNYSCRAQRYAEDVLQIPSQNDEEYQYIDPSSLSSSVSIEDVTGSFSELEPTSFPLHRSGSNELPVCSSNQSASYLFTYKERVEELSNVRTFTTSKHRSYIISPNPPSAYISHILYLKQSSISVDEEEISALGIKCISLESAPSLLGGHYPANELSDILQSLMQTNF